MSEGYGCGMKEREGDSMRTWKNFSVRRILCIYRTLQAAQKK